MELFSLILLGVVSFFIGILAAVVGSSQIILIPLMTIFGMPIHTALGTFKIAAVGRDLSSSINYGRKKLINIKKTSVFFIPAAIGSIFGASFVISLSPLIVERIIGIFMIILALLFINNTLQKITDKIPRSRKKFFLPILGLGVGFYEGFYGAADALFMIAIFVSLLHFDFLRAAANAKFVNLIQASFGAAVFVINGLIDYQVVIPLLIGLSTGAWYGVEIATKIGKIWVKRIFIFFSIILGLKFILFP